MLRGVALATFQIPAALLEDLAPRRVERGGEAEFQFLWHHIPRLLPVLTPAGLGFVTWGNRRGESREMPCTGSAAVESFEAGKWAAWNPRPAEVPAALAMEGKVWFSVTQGVRGIVVTDERGLDRLFVLAEPSSFYYQLMTRGKWMPVLVGERI
jgi:hypothetical protein